MTGLFQKIRNQATRQRFLVSTIRKEEHLFETAVFAATFFFLPKGLRLNRPLIVIKCTSSEEADAIHTKICRRLREEHPARVLQEYS